MFNLEVQYGNVRAVLHEITVEVVSVGEVLLAELPLLLEVSHRSEILFFPFGD